MVKPFPLIFVIVSPVIPSGSVRVVRAESTVTFHELEASRLSVEVFIAPDKVEPFFRFADIELIASVTSEPVSCSPSALNIPIQPFFPSVPHPEVAVALIRTAGAPTI